MRPDPQVITRWHSSAPYWEKHREAVRRMFSPVASALVEDVGYRAGDAILDVATGNGEMTLSFASGGASMAVGVDAIPAMAAGGQREGSRCGLGSRAHFIAALADQLPLADETFDSIVCRFGVMFFPSPVDAVREMLRVLKPGRALAFAVWNEPKSNPFFSAMTGVISRYFPPEPQVPDAPDGFRFAAPGKLLAILAEAGVTDPAERLLKFGIDFEGSLEDFWTVRSEMSESLREKINKLSKDDYQQVTGEVISALKPYATSYGVNVPAQVRIISGSKGPRLPGS